MSINVKITGSGHFLPGEPIPFKDVDYYLGELTEAPVKVKKWLSRIKVIMNELIDTEYYHYAIDPKTREFTEDNISMSVKAARQAISDAGLETTDIDFIAYGSAHQDQMPTASVRIQEGLGIESCGEMSIHANCTSAYKALMTAFEFIKSGRYKKALVISSSMASSELRAEYYNQQLVRKEELFLRYFLSDGAAALVLEAGDHSNRSGLHLESCYIESIGGNKPSAMGNKRPAYFINPMEEYNKGYHHLSQMFNENLRELFHEDDGSVFVKGLQRMLGIYPIDLQMIRYFQVNFPSKHISELVMEECEKIGIPANTLYTSMSTMGYIGPPMAFLCLDKIRKEENLSTNDIILSFVTEVSKFMQAGYVCKYY